MRFVKFILCASLMLAAALPDAARADLDQKEWVPGYIRSTSKGAERDSIWALGHAYRQWTFDQNSISDDNSNLDAGIVFLDEGRVRSHPERVYFYNDIPTAFRKARETGKGLVFYLFDHTCSECLFILPQLYTLPEVVEASKDFVNCYVELPLLSRDATANGLMASSLTVQFFLPGGRRLRVLDSPDLAKLMESYGQMNKYIGGLDEETLMAEPRRGFRPSRGGY